MKTFELLPVVILMCLLNSISAIIVFILCFQTALLLLSTESHLHFTLYTFSSVQLFLFLNK